MPVPSTSATSATASLRSPEPESIPLSQEKPLKLGVMASGSGSNFEAVARAIAFFG